jgi:hypothetical protein
VLQRPAAAFSPDAAGYHELAGALLQGQFPSLFRTPGYPLFLALTGATSSEQIGVALIVQMLLDSLSAVLLAAIARRLVQDEMTSLLTGLFYAFCPVMARLCAFILSEPLSIFFLIAALYLALAHRSPLGFVAQIFCWFAATMARPSFVPLPLIVSFFLLLRPELKLAWRKQLFVLGAYSLLVAGWMGFNYARAGMAVLTTNPQVSFYIYEPPTVRLVDQLSWPDYIRLAVLNPPEYDRLFAVNETAIARELLPAQNPPPENLWFTKDDPAAIKTIGARATALVEGRTWTLAGIHLVGVLQSLRPKWNSAGTLNRLLDTLRVMLLPVALWLLVQRKQWWWLAMVVVWTAYALLPPGPVSAWRFRSLAEPIFSLVLAMAFPPALSGIWSQAKRMKRALATGKKQPIIVE